MVENREPFFKIVPYDNKYLGYNIGYIPLKVIQDSGIEVVPDLNINVTDLNAKNGVLYKHFYNQGTGGITFKIEVMIGRTDVIDGIYPKKVNTKVTKVLDYLISSMTPVMVRTSAIDVEEKIYIITKNSSRKQTFPNYTIWNLEFTTYNPLTVVKYVNDNSRVLKAIKKSIKANKKKKRKASASNKLKLKKCKLSQLKYSKRKKVVKCVKYMQKVLYQKGCFKKKNQIDGWYGKKTITAVKLFQKKYKKQYKLKVTGKVDKKTFKAMLKV